MFSSNSAIIRHERELFHHFRQLLVDETELVWVWPSEVPAREGLPWVELRLDTQTHRFKPVYFLRPSIPDLESILKEWSDLHAPMLVVPELVPRILEFCRRKRLAAVDLNGRAYLRAEGLLVDRCPLPGRDFRFELEPRNIFVGKSARIIRCLLTDRDRIWSQGELVGRSRASGGLVSRIVQHLVNQGYLEKQGARAFRVGDPRGLIDAWAKADDFNRRTTAARYTTLTGSPIELAHRLTIWCKGEAVPIAFTQWFAGWLRHPYTEPVVVSAYVGRLPGAGALEELGLRPVNDAGKVCLLLPDDEGIFLETQNSHGLTLASDAQIYLDLQGTGLRGPEQAEALRHWEGFCRR